MYSLSITCGDHITDSGVNAFGNILKDYDSYKFKSKMYAIRIKNTLLIYILLKIIIYEDKELKQ